MPIVRNRPDIFNVLFGQDKQNFVVYLHNKINFPQAKLNSEINARVLLNEHGNLYFFIKGGKFLKKLWCCVGRSITR